MAKDGQIFKQSEEKIYKQSDERRFMVMFKQNRREDFKFGRLIYSFSPYEIQELPESVINHPDFQQQKSCFTIKEM